MKRDTSQKSRYLTSSIILDVKSPKKSPNLLKSVHFLNLFLRPTIMHNDNPGQNK